MHKFLQSPLCKLDDMARSSCNQFYNKWDRSRSLKLRATSRLWLVQHFLYQERHIRLIRDDITYQFVLNFSDVHCMSHGWFFMVWVLKWDSAYLEVMFSCLHWLDLTKLRKRKFVLSCEYFEFRYHVFGLFFISSLFLYVFLLICRSVYPFTSSSLSVSLSVWEAKRNCRNVKGCSHEWFCALWLTSGSMCLTDESVEDKLESIISGYLATQAVMSLK